MEVPKYGDNDESIAELQARITKTIAFLQTLKPEQIDSSEDKDISLDIGGRPMTYKGLPYLLHVATTNFYFTCDNGLRHFAPQRGRDRQARFYREGVVPQPRGRVRRALIGRSTGLWT